MQITKTKSYTTVPLREIKEHLNIDDSDYQYDSQLNSIIKTVISEIEKRTTSDIVPTVNSLEDYCLVGSCYTVFEPNININSVILTNNILTTPTSAATTNYIIKKGNQYTEILFKNSISAEKINISYNSGFSSMPSDLLHAIKIRVAYYFDADRNGTLTNNVNESKAFDRLIYAYTNLLF